MPYVNEDGVKERKGGTRQKGKRPLAPLQTNVKVNSSNESFECNSISWLG